MIKIYIIFLNVVFHFFKNRSVYSGVALWVRRPTLFRLNFFSAQFFFLLNFFGANFFSDNFFSANFFSSTYFFSAFFSSRYIFLILLDFLLSILFLPNHPLEFFGFVWKLILRPEWGKNYEMPNETFCRTLHTQKNKCVLSVLSMIFFVC